MSTRANIVVKGGEFTPTITYYKHCDGYIQGGLGEMLAEFVKDNLDEEDFRNKITKSKFMSQYIVWVTKKYGDNSYAKDIEITDIVHGDIEYMYLFKDNELGVYIREEWRTEKPFEESYKDWKYVTLVNKDIYNLDIFGKIKA